MTRVSNQDAWENIFNDLQILDKIQNNGYYDIGADEIKKRDGKESRLMTKIDHRENLPKIMADNQLSILAIKNGLYRIARTDPFINIKKEIQCQIQTIEKPNNIYSINPTNIRSESEALNIVHITKILSKNFEEEVNLTVRGRLRGDLKFQIEKIPYDIQGVQIEVDGGYEGLSSLHLIEAKMGYRSNINIRQLLYPELFWKNQTIASKKQIKSYLFLYQENIFRFIPFSYENGLFSLQHDKEKAFQFKEKINFNLSSIVKPTQDLTNSEAPFPQADDFEKVHNILLKINQFNNPSKWEVMQDFDITERQYDYYLNVLVWMNLCSINKEIIALNDKGLELAYTPFNQRIQEFAKIIFSNSICFKELKGDQTNFDDLKQDYHYAEETINRRLNTIRAWIKYFKNLSTS